jgi:putative ABC transport system permease protein
VNAAWKLYIRLILRPLVHDRLRTALTALAVTLGVGVVIAIDLAGQAATGSFRSSLQTLSGRSDLVITATGGLDESLLGKLVTLPYPLDFSPRIRDFAFLNAKGEAIPFVGLDLIAHGENQASLLESTSASSDQVTHLDSNAVWVSKHLSLPVGSKVKLLINDRLHDFTVQGVFDAGAEGAESNLIVADIGLAQESTGKQGRLDAIDVTVPKELPVSHWQQLIQKEVPASTNVELQGTQTDQNRKMLSAFRWNLRVLSYIALVVGAFLIYNTISISVVRRRAEIGLVRAVGATRRAVVAAFFSEAIFYALLGGGLGLVAGRLMALGAVRLIGNTVQSLYISGHPAPVQFTAPAVASGLALGLAAALLAACGPSLEAARVAPVEAMARGREQYDVAVRSRHTAYWGFAILAVGAIFALLPAIGRQPVFAYLAVLAVIAGTALLIPNLVTGFSGWSRGFMARFFGPEAMLASQSLRASPGRSSVLIAALTTAIAMTVSVGIMVGSFRETVWVWMNGQLKADFYLRPAGASAADRHPTMSASIADGISRMPGVAAVDRFRAYPIFYEGLPATFAGGESSNLKRSGGTRFLPGENETEILRKLPTGDFAVVSEPFANKHRIRVGSSLTLPLAGATRSFQVLGIYYDYSTEGGFIIVDRSTLLKYLPGPALSNLAVYLEPGADPDRVHHGIDSVISGRAVLVFSNRSLRNAAIALFDRTFRITYALEAVAILVAVMGIAGALLAMVIDRRREFALLRFLGAAQQQVRAIILCEAGLLGLFSSAIGLVLGTLMSLILIFVINKQSFGWTIQFHWPVLLLVAAVGGVYIATVLAGLYPARTAIRTNPIEVLHEA